MLHVGDRFIFNKVSNLGITKCIQIISINYNNLNGDQWQNLVSF